jgi:hypothetical protein
MKVIVQDPATLYFLRADSSWTPDIHSRHDFRHTADAINTCTQNGIDEFRIILDFEDSRSKIERVHSNAG